MQQAMTLSSNLRRITSCGQQLNKCLAVGGEQGRQFCRQSAAWGWVLIPSLNGQCVPPRVGWVCLRTRVTSLLIVAGLPLLVVMLC